MARLSEARLQELSELLMEWPLKVERAISNPESQLTSTEHAEWATHASGDVRWALQALRGVISTDELLATVGVVARWGMAGVLHEALVIIGGPRLAEHFTELLKEGGYIPFVLPAHQEEGSQRGRSGL